MKHIFLNKFENGTFIVEKEKFHHLYNVLRIRDKDEKINVIFENKIYITEIIKIENERYFLKPLNYKNLILPKIKIDLLLSNIDFDNLKLIVEKISEIGISNLYLFKSLFSNINFYDEKKIDKLKKNSYLACEQSGNPFPLNIYQLKNIDNFDFEDYKLKFILYEKKDINIKFLSINDIIKISQEIKYNNSNDKKNESKNKILFLIGPEGGFDKKEFDFFYNLNFYPINLGENILRCETAAISFSFLLKFIFS